MDNDAGDDWLDEPEAHYVGVLEAAESARRVATIAEVNDASANALVPIVCANVEMPSDVKKQSQLLQDSWNELAPIQQLFLSLLRDNHFNTRKSVRKMQEAGRGISRQTARNWMDDANFHAVHTILTSIKVGDAIKKERLLLRAEEIADEALEPKPILHKGLPTGFYENQPDTALRANEQLMKATGVLRDAQQSTRVTVRLVNLAGPEHEAIEGEAEVIE